MFYRLALGGVACALAVTTANLISAPPAFAMGCSATLEGKARNRDEYEAQRLAIATWQQKVRRYYPECNSNWASAAGKSLTCDQSMGGHFNCNAVGDPGDRARRSK